MRKNLLLASLYSFMAFYLHAQHFDKVATVATNNERSSRTAGLIDINQDGLVDIFFTNGDQTASEIYLNQGEGVFQLSSDRAINSTGLRAVGANWIDVENDGDLDMYVTTWGTGTKNYLFLNGPDGLEIDQSSILNITNFSEAAGWADYNSDGYLDAIVANSNSGVNLFFTNNGDGTFRSISINGSGGDSRCASWADWDNDGDQDLIVTNEAHDVYAYLNGPDGLSASLDLFPDKTYTAFGASWGDMDNDGDLDLFLARFSAPNVLLENDNGVFTEVPSSGLSENNHPAIGSSWGDIDNDGDLDLIVTNGFVLRMYQLSFLLITETRLLQRLNQRSSYPRWDHIMA